MTNRSILQSALPKIATVQLTDGKEVRIRELSGKGRAEYLKLYQDAEPSGGLRSAQVVALALVEEDGSSSFDMNKPEDLAFLDGLSGETLDKIAIAFYQLSGLTSKAVDDARGN